MKEERKKKEEEKGGREKKIKREWTVYTAGFQAYAHASRENPVGHASCPRHGGFLLSGKLTMRAATRPPTASREQHMPSHRGFP